MTGRYRSLVVLGVAVLTLWLAGEAAAQPHSCNTSLGTPSVCNVSAQPENWSTDPGLSVTWTGANYSSYALYLCYNVGNDGQWCDYTNPNVIAATLLNWTPAPWNPALVTRTDHVRVPACIPGNYYRVVVKSANGGAFDVGWSNLLTLTQVRPCLTDVIADTPAGPGFRTHVHWNTDLQTRYALNLLDANGNYLETITNWVPTGVHNHTWDIRPDLPVGIYRVEVKVANGDVISTSWTAPFWIKAPTVSNVTATPVQSCFTDGSTYAGQPVKVSWSSTDQESWELLYCQNGQCPSTGLSGGTEQTTTWTPPPSLTGTLDLWVRVTANTFTRQAKAPTLNLRPRPSVFVQWQYADSSVTEGDDPDHNVMTNTPALVTTQPAGAMLPDPVVVSYTTVDDTALAGGDYSYRNSTQPQDGPIVFPRCQTLGGATAQLPHPIFISGDQIYEGNESFLLRITGATGATWGTTGQLTQHRFTIVDDDTAPPLSVSDATVTEGNLPGGTVAATFTVTLTGNTLLPVSYTVSTAPDTGPYPATAPEDYIAFSQGDSIPAGNGTRTRTYTVLVKSDQLDEDDETFRVKLTGVQNAMVVRDGIGTIDDDDPLPVLSLQPVTVGEAAGQALFRAVLTPVSGRSVAGSYYSQDGTATSTPPAPDYTAVAAGFQIAPGANGTDIAVPIVSDALHEADETFSLTLQLPYNATLSATAATAVGTITDDDAPPQVSLTDASTDEPFGGSVAGEWSVHLSAASGLPVTVPFTTAACTATPGTDYVAAASGSLTFAPGVTSQPIPFTVQGDTAVEGHEFFGALLGTPAGATLADGYGQSVILDNQAPVLAITRSDFNVDGDNDVVWFDASTGSYGVWFLKGLRRADSAAFDPPAPAAGWALANVADFNNDNHPDLLWRNATSGRLVIWYMNGVTRTSAALVDPPVDVTWTLVGTARLDNNSSTDLVFRNPATGELWAWLMDGVTLLEQRALTPSVPAAGWIPQFLGDLNADGKADLVFRNQTSGALVAWIMDGTVRTEGRSITGATLDSHWDAVGAFDADVDGTTDLAFQNHDYGSVFVVLMSGTTPRCGVYVVPEDPVSLGRRVFGPR